MEISKLPILVAGGMMFCSATAYAEETYRLESPYDPAAHEIRDGNNVIRGNALIPLTDGDDVTCRGKVVDLVPVTPYTTERMMATFESDQEGFRGVRIKRKGFYIKGFGKRTRDPIPHFEPENEHYQRSAGRTTRCDSRGDFEFSGVADGEYYITTVITWQYSGYIPDGGALMTRVRLRGGQPVRVVLAP